MEKIAKKNKGFMDLQRLNCVNKHLTTILRSVIANILPLNNNSHFKTSKLMNNIKMKG